MLYRKINNYRVTIIIVFFLLLAFPIGGTKANSLRTYPGAGTIPTVTNTSSPTVTKTNTTAPTATNTNTEPTATYTNTGIIATLAKTRTPTNITITITGTLDKTLTATNIPTTYIKIYIDRDIREFTKSEQDKFIQDLAAALNININQIRIIRIEAGSIIITLEIPIDASQKLYSMYINNDPSAQGMKIIKIEILPTPTPTTQSTQKRTVAATITPRLLTIQPSATYPEIRIATYTPVSNSSIFSSSKILTTFLLILGGVFILTILGVGGFLLLKPKP